MSRQLLVMFATLFLALARLLFLVVIILPLTSYMARKAVLLTQSFLSPVSDVPGPLIARISRIFKLWQVFRGSFEDTVSQLHQKHGENMQSERHV